MKKNTYISPELVTNAGNQKAMIFFFFLKSKYQKSVFYNYKPERIAQITGISVNTVRKYVSWLQRQGYITKPNGNLSLRSIRKITDNRHYILVDSVPWTNWKQFTNRVYAGILKWNNKKQAFHYNGKRFVSGKHKEYCNVRAFLNYIKNYGKDTKETETLRPINSVRQVAKLFNKSTGWANNLLNRLQQMGYIKLKQKTVFLNYGYVPPKFCEKGYVYFNPKRKGMILHQGTQIKFNY